MIWTDHFHWISRVQHNTHISFHSTVLFSAPCSVRSTECAESLVNNIQRRLRRSQKSESLSLSHVYCCVHCVCVHSVLTKTYRFLWADEAANVSSPLDVLQHLSLAVRSNQTHVSLSRLARYSEVSSHSETSCVWKHKCVCVVQKWSIFLF